MEKRSIIGNKLCLFEVCSTSELSIRTVLGYISDKKLYSILDDEVIELGNKDISIRGFGFNAYLNNKGLGHLIKEEYTKEDIVQINEVVRECISLQDRSLGTKR